MLLLRPLSREAMIRKSPKNARQWFFIAPAPLLMMADLMPSWCDRMMKKARVLVSAYAEDSLAVDEEKRIERQPLPGQTSSINFRRIHLFLHFSPIRYSISPVQSENYLEPRHTEKSTKSRNICETQIYYSCSVRVKVILDGCLSCWPTFCLPPFCWPPFCWPIFLIVEHPLRSIICMSWIVIEVLS